MGSMTPTSGCEAKTKQTEEAPAKMPDAGFEATGSLFGGVGNTGWKTLEEEEQASLHRSMVIGGQVPAGV